MQFTKPIRLAQLVLLLAMPAATTQAFGQASPCSVGSASIQLPSAVGVIQGSPASVRVNAQVGTPGNAPPPNCRITAIRLYVDNQANQLEYVSAPQASVDFKTSLPNGIYNLVGVAYDNDGYAFVTNALQLYIGNTDKTVYVPAPVTGSTSSDPVTIMTYTRWDATGPNQAGGSQSIFTRVYVDNRDVYDSKSPMLGFQKIFSAGVHHLVVVSYNGVGATFLKSPTVTFTVR